MGNNFQTNSLKERVLVITVPDVELSMDKMLAVILNDIPSSNVALQESIAANGTVAAIYSYLECKHGNKQTLNAHVQMQLVEYGTFETNLNRSKNSLMEEFGMDTKAVDFLLDTLRKRLIHLFPEFGEHNDK